MQTGIKLVAIKFELISTPYVNDLVIKVIFPVFTLTKLPLYSTVMSNTYNVVKSKKEANKNYDIIPKPKDSNRLIEYQQLYLYHTLFP